MKKILTLALAIAAVGSMSAQKEAVKTAQKLSGKIEKLSEARAAIKPALQDAETANDANTWLVAAEIENKGYDAMKKKLAIQPAPEDLLKMDQLLLNGYPYLVKAAELDTKGALKGKIAKTLLTTKDNYYTAGADFFNNHQYYPQAYDAFMIYGDMPDVEAFGGLVMIPDTIRANAYYNAGMAAYYNPEPQLLKAAEAFKKARLNNYPEAKAYIFELASWQNLMRSDSTMIEPGRKAILDVSRAGWDKYGMTQPVFLNNLVNVYVDADQEPKAIEMLTDLLQQNELAAIYGLRGFVYDRMGKDAESVADYRKAVSFPDTDYETLTNAAKKLYRNCTQERNALEISDPQYKAKLAQILSDLQNTREIATRAKANIPEGGSSSDIEYVLEQIDYALEQLAH